LLNVNKHAKVYYLNQKPSTDWVGKSLSLR